MKNYEKKVKNSQLDVKDKNYVPLHIPRGFKSVQRMEKKMLAKSNWYKKDGKNKENEQVIEEEPRVVRNISKGRKGQDKDCSKGKEKPVSTVMFVPWTSKGKLVGRLKEEENRLSGLTDFKIKFQEEGGTPLWLMFKTSLVDGMECGRKDCRTCRQDDERKVDCFARSVVY